jgi:hypothetical protein
MAVYERSIIRQKSLVVSASEIRRRSGPQRPPKHGNERARRAVARFQSSVRDFSSFRQKPHRLHQTKLLSPLTERHPGFFLEKSFDRSLRGARSLADLCEWPAVAWVGKECLRDSECAAVGQIGKLQGDHPNDLELIDNHVYQVPLPQNAVLQHGKPASMKHEFLQQWRHIYYATVSWQGLCEAWSEVKGSHGDRARHGDGMWNGRRYPNRAVGRDDPSPGAGTHGHYSARGIDDLIAIVKVRRDHIPGRVVVGQSSNRGAVIS